MLLKTYSLENLPDNDPRKAFSAVANVASVDFVRDENGVTAEVMINGNPTTVKLMIVGNTYLLGDDGAVISVFVPDHLAPHEQAPKPEQSKGSDDLSEPAVVPSMDQPAF